MTRETFPIASPGWTYLVVLAAITGIFYWSYKPASVVTALLFLFTVYFFRNPRRTIPGDRKAILSPADGVVMSVSSVREDRFIGGPAKKVSIFLSIFNVHVNRSPVAGEVKYIDYVPGKFLPAFKSHASEINERNYLGIESSGARVLVCQVTGFIARRIVCYAKEGGRLDRGQVFGMIKFGSCTEIFVPEDVDVLVGPGDSVKGGETIIGRFPDEN
ncbi:MAG: phosphatidylserine decarboxylase family protein [Peptococcaceae bacterium]|nr:phosphatidylserine decarboxylase family protein [Peptococcaceae bacterium]